MCDAGSTVTDIWTVLVPALVVILGWGVVHFSSKRKDLQNRKREVVSKYLIDAYRGIENCCGRGIGSELTTDQKRVIEQAVADVQLFGSASQITLVKKFIESMNASSYGDPRSLLVILRNDLRKELGLSAASDDSSDIVHWRLL